MYIIRKTFDESKIIYMEYDNPSYEIKIDTPFITNLYVYDKRYIPKENNKIPFEYIFSNLTQTVFNYIYSDDDSDEGTSGRLISEVDKTKAMLESEYKEYMKRQDYYSYLDKISFLKDEIRNKMEIDKYKQNINNLITGKSR